MEQWRLVRASRRPEQYRSRPLYRWAAVFLAGVVLGSFSMPVQAAETTRKPVTISFWNWWDGTRIPVMNQIIKEFHQRYPWITVKSEVQGWDNISAKMLAAYASGSPPDVLMARRAEITALADMGAIRPITDLVARDKLDLNMFYPAEVEAFRYDGQLWSLPLPTVTANDDFYFYNREMFDAAGLDPNRPPETWSAMLEANRKLTRRDESGSISQLGVRASPSEFIPFLYSNNGRFLSPDLRKVAFDGLEGKQAAQFISDIATMNGGGKQTEFFSRYDTATGAAFMHGREAILFENVSVMNLIIQDAVKTGRRLDWWGLGFIPYNDKNPKAKSTGVAGLSFGWGYVMPKNLPPDKQEAAWLWIKFLTTDPMGGGLLMFAQGRPAPVRAFNENPEYRKLNPNWDKLLRAMETDVAFPAIPIQTDLVNAVIDRFWSVANASVSPDDALTKAAQTAQNALDKYWAKRR